MLWSRSMKIARIPLVWLPLIALAMAAVGALFMAMFGEAHVRGAYQVWQENETFAAAAAVALLAAMYAARPVYLQVRAQSVQAALDLLHRIEADTEACIEARKMLFEVRRTAVALAGDINAYAGNASPSSQHLKESIAAFMATSPRQLRALAERPTINAADQEKIASMSFVLSIAQQIAADLAAEGDNGVIPREAVEKECAFLSTKLTGLFALSSDIAEDLERQEEEMRARAQQLRDTADTF
jgi:hypothetical protein